MKYFFTLWLVVLFLFPYRSSGLVISSRGDRQKGTSIQEDKVGENLKRAIRLIDDAYQAYFSGTEDNLKMSRYYNPFTKERSKELGSIWMYGAVIQSLTYTLEGLREMRDKGNGVLYEREFDRLSNLLKLIYENADYYIGSYTLTSATQTKEWSVYAVNRAKEKGKARVRGKLNVYDDQMWLVKDLLRAFKVTGDKTYLRKAEYLVDYVLDGWDVHLDKKGKEIGGIPWGPGYVSKHACSNGPMISPLVWLATFYDEKQDKILHRYVDARDGRTRRSVMEQKSSYYLSFAKKIYHWQKTHLLTEKGIYNDFISGDCDRISYEVIDGNNYRASCPLGKSVGPPYSYNTGVMLSGGARLFDVTKDSLYLEDIKRWDKAGFSYFAQKNADRQDYYSYPVKGFSPWFNSILLEGYCETKIHDGQVSVYLKSFQDNLDFAYENYLKGGMLPRNLLKGWNQEEKDTGHNVEGIFTFGYAAQFAMLALSGLQ